MAVTTAATTGETTAVTIGEMTAGMTDVTIAAMTDVTAVTTGASVVTAMTMAAATDAATTENHRFGADPRPWFKQGEMARLHA